MQNSKFICVLLLSVFLTVIISAQPNNSDWTIDQYYSNLPSTYLPILDKYKKRESLVREVDYPNRYILLVHDEWKGWGEMALFEKKSGGQIAAVTQYDCTGKYPYYPYFDSPKCDGKITFLEESGGNLIEIKDVIPDVKKLMLYHHWEKKTGRLADSDDKLIFELPRERKDILIKLAKVLVYSYVWDGEKFVGSYID